VADSRTLIAYYSRKGQNYGSAGIVDLPVGNTEVAATMIQAATGGELLRLDTVKEYPGDYHAATEVAKSELREGARPELRNLPHDIDGYDVVFVGYPIWWGTPPMAVFTFLDAYDFTGKTVVPFCTHEGSGMGRSERDIETSCPGARVLDGLAIRGASVRGAETDIERWILGTGLTF